MQHLSGTNVDKVTQTIKLLDIEGDFQNSSEILGNLYSFLRPIILSLLDATLVRGLMRLLNPF